MIACSLTGKNKIFLLIAALVFILSGCNNHNRLNAHDLSGTWDSLPSKIGGKMAFMFDTTGHSYQVTYTEGNGQISVGQRRPFFVINDSVIALNGKERPYWRKVWFSDDGRMGFLYYEAKLREDVELSYEYEYQRVK